MKNNIKTIWLTMAMFALIVAPFSLYADEAKDRQKLISTAEQLLDKMSAEIKGFDKDASAQDTVDAVRLSVTLSKSLADLKKVQGDDDQAQEMASNWPGHVKAFQAAAVRLAKMKNLQIALNDATPDACKVQQRRLDEVIKAYLPQKKAEGMSEIPKVARSVGGKASAMMSKAKGTVKMSEVTLREISGFGARGEWSGLSAAVQGAAKSMHRAMADKQKAIDESCDELAQGDKNPVVVTARENIAQATGSALAALQVMVDKWEKDAAGFFKTDCKAMQRMATAYCGVDAGDDDGRSEVDRLKSEVASIVREVKTENKELIDELVEIRKYAKELAQQDELKNESGQILKELEDELKKIEGLQRAGAM
ncbi:MAG: hypothetical protein JKY27_10340, partial [Magnetovibrio sp.]|nr:hypothetical protein [Magnetovibrio sp.]